MVTDCSSTTITIPSWRAVFDTRHLPPPGAMHRQQERRRRPCWMQHGRSMSHYRDEHMSDTTTFPVDEISTSPKVTLVTAPNPGPKTLSGTHTYLVGQDSAYIIDPGPIVPEYQQFLT